MSMRNGCKLAIFVKAPVAGRVKTRLARQIGDEAACDAYRELVLRLLGNLQGLREVELRFTPDDAAGQLSGWLREWIPRLTTRATGEGEERGRGQGGEQEQEREQEAEGRRGAWVLAPQGGGDLGERLTRTFEESFQQGYERVTIIGSDCPGVTVKDIEAGWGALDNYDVVCGPATDGGYWLVGMRSMRRELFRDVPWSGPDVLRTTLARARDAALRVALLRELSDVDTAADWERFRRGVLF